MGKIFFALAVQLFLTSAWAGSSIPDAVEQFVFQQTQALPGKVSIAIAPIAPTTRLQECQKMEVYLPPGTRLWGKSSVGVRCQAPQGWNILVPVTVRVSGEYVTTARSVAAGQVLGQDDLLVVSGDMTTLPGSVVFDPKAAIGKSSRNALPAGQILRNDQLLAPLAIRAGQTVRIVSSGPGFAVSSEGKALGNATAGQVVQVRMATGQVITAVARQDGNAEISF